MEKLPTGQPRRGNSYPCNLWGTVERVGEKTKVRHVGSHERGVRDALSGLEEIQQG